MEGTWKRLQVATTELRISPGSGTPYALLRLLTPENRMLITPIPVVPSAALRNLEVVRALIDFEERRIFEIEESLVNADPTTALETAETLCHLLVGCMATCYVVRRASLHGLPHDMIAEVTRWEPRDDVELVTLPPRRM